MADVKINFRISGADELRRAFDGITVKAQRGAAAAVRAQQTGAKESVAAARRAKNEMLTDAEALAKAEIALIQRVNRERVNAAKSQVQLQREAAAQQERILAAQERAARASNRRQVAGEVGSGLANGFKRGVGIIGGVAGAVTGAIGVAGIQSALQERLALGKANAQLAADVNEPGGKPLDQAKMIATQQRIAKNTGIASLDVADAMGVAAGEGGGMKGLTAFTTNIDKMAEISLASGTKLQDIAKLSATLTNNMVTDADKQIEVITNLLGAAKKNNVNLRDEAEKIMTVAGAHQSGGFLGDGTSRVEQAGALMQIAKLGGASNREDAATAARNFYSDLSSHEANIRKLGVRTIDKGTGKRVDAVDQFIQLVEKTKGDITKIDPQFGSQSASVFGAMMAAFRGENTDLKGEDGKTLTGRAAVEKLMKESATGGMSYADVEKDSAIVKDDASNKMARAMEDFKARVGNDLLPVLTQNIDAFAKLAGGVAQATKVFAESPEKVAVGLVAFSTAIGGAQAVLGRIGTGILDKLFANKAVGTMAVTAGSVVVSGSAPGVPPPGGGGAPGATPVAAGTGPSKLVTALGVVGAGIGGIMVGKHVADGLGDKERAGLDANIANASNLASKIRMGTATPEEMARARALKGELAGEADKGFFGRAIDGATSGIRGLAKGDFSASNIVSAIPTASLIRGGLEAVGGGQGKGAAADAAAELSSALAKATMKIDPASQITIANPDAIAAPIAAAISAGNLQGPKAQTE